MGSLTLTLDREGWNTPEGMSHHKMICRKGNNYSNPYESINTRLLCPTEFDAEGVIYIYMYICVCVCVSLYIIAISMGSKKKNEGKQENRDRNIAPVDGKFIHNLSV